MCGCLSCAPYWEPGPQPGMCPNWESNQRPFGSQAGTQPTEPHQPGHVIPLKITAGRSLECCVYPHQDSTSPGLLEGTYCPFCSQIPGPTPLLELNE